MMYRIKQTFLLLTLNFCWTSYAEGYKGSRSTWGGKSSECFAQQNQGKSHQVSSNGETNNIEHGERIFPTSSCGKVIKDSGRHRRAASDLFDPPELNRRSDAQSSISDSSVYFSGSSEILRFKSLGMNSTIANLHFPRYHFTVTLWVQPEGGQVDPTIILGLYDTCSASWTWSLGIRTSSDDGERSPSFFLDLQTERSRRTTRLLSHKPVLPTRWTHLSAVYDGRRVFLYVDGGRVAANGGQRGPLFASSRSSCKLLLLGGSQTDKKYFRGKVNDLVIIDNKLTHGEIREMMKNGLSNDRDSHSYHSEQFNSLENFDVYERKGGKEPRLMTSDLLYDRHDIRLVPPPCGMTICDDPDLVLSYVDNWRMRMPKTVKYRVINIVNDDGSNPTVTPEQIKRQDRTMNEAFGPHNITFKLSELRVANTSLRKKVILDNCEPEMIGDKTCHCQCQHPITGNDGGDCDLTHIYEAFCDHHLIGNARCDENCNYKDYDWDGGDCCLPDSPTSCRDPNSPFRPYMSLAEYKRLLALPADSDLNVFFANWTDPDVLGIATFPWARHVHSIMGGIVMQPDVYGVVGRTDNMIHELGHIFGLLHVHHGISEVDCEDPCLETEPSLALGDLCADTNPTPTNGHCRDPDGGVQQCGLGPYEETPYRNFMAYTDDDCMDHFTPHQAARMHCYLDLAYQRWQVIPKPSPVPLPPRVVASTTGSVEFRWVPPIGSGRTAIDPICSHCRADHSLVQFAATASYNGMRDSDEAWSPLQATGPPDSKPCSPSVLAWRPPVMDPLCMGSSCVDDHVLEVSFGSPVVPKRLTMWIIYNASKAIRDVELVFKDRVSQSLGPITAQCDVPYTTQLSMEKLLTKVRIHTRGSFVAIDAVMLESRAEHSGCSVCPTIQYAITREPQFQNGRVITDDSVYMDSDVSDGESFTYHVQTMLGSKLSEKSPPLIYTHGQHFCGDGKLQRNEDCDDGNAVNGDGCDLLCKVEGFFRCSGSPSTCVHHVGDGICEEKERRTVLTDCGFYTPEGVTDQWAVEVRGDPLYHSPQCHEGLITGKPSYETVETCQVRSFWEHPIWSPCAYDFFASYFWIEAYFARNVVATNVLVYAHVKEVRLESGIMRNHTMSAMLIDTNNATHSTGPDLTFSCLSRPMIFNVFHDLSRDFYLSKGVRIIFHSPFIGISAVALRSRKGMSHISVDSCSQDEVYSPHTGQCISYECDRPSCLEFAIKHGNASCSGLSEGDKCHVQCHPGYELVEGYREAICSRGDWIGARLCTPVQCGLPSIPHAKLDCPDGYSFGKKCKFECIKPAKKIGTGSSILCEDDGMWSLPEAFCQMRCEAPPTVKNSTMTTQACRQQELKVGSQCRYKCHKGFHVVGQNLKRRVMRYSCSDLGSWIGPSCERVHCREVDSVYHGLYSCTMHNYAGSTCTLKCPGPNRVTSTITCQQDGTWDEDFTECKFEPGECPEIPASQNVTIACLNGYEIGAKCQLSCLEFDHEAVLNSHHGSSQGRGRTSRNDIVRQITCTGQKEWFPDITSVTCVEKCREAGIGDGFCEAPNNRAHCHWDGGDCCTTNTPDGDVKLLDDSCTSECQCKDPNAPEKILSDSGITPSPGFFARYFQLYQSMFSIDDEENLERKEDGSAGL